jgi:hypothetical protein
VLSEQSPGSREHSLAPTFKDVQKQKSTYIPYNNSLGTPSDANLDIVAQSNVVVKELEEVVALFLLETDNLACELRIDK